MDPINHGYCKEGAPGPTKKETVPHIFLKGRHTDLLQDWSRHGPEHVCLMVSRGSLMLLVRFSWVSCLQVPSCFLPGLCSETSSLQHVCQQSMHCSSIGTFPIMGVTQLFLEARASSPTSASSTSKMNGRLFHLTLLAINQSHCASSAIQTWSSQSKFLSQRGLLPATPASPPPNLPNPVL